VSIAATRGSSDDMSATINIHQSMRHLTDGRAVVEVRGDTVGECLEYLIDQYPDVKTKARIRRSLKERLRKGMN
jgi:hypothetical protein